MERRVRDRSIIGLIHRDEKAMLGNEIDHGVIEGEKNQFMQDMKFQNNIGTFSVEELEILSNSKVLVVGCGGSEYVIDALVRLGISTIGVVDGDTFEESNINRQLFSNISNIGKFKVDVANEYVHRINPDINFRTYPIFISETNCDDLIREYNIVLDCVDNIESKIIIQRACESLGKPLVFGGLSRWYGQVGISFPGDNLVEKVYSISSKRKTKRNKEEIKLSSTTAFMNAFVSSLYVAMCAKVLVGKKCSPNMLYLFDLYNMRVIRLKFKRKFYKKEHILNLKI